MTKTLTVNSQELADLQLVIQTYENKIGKQSKGEKVAVLAYRPMENTKVTFTETYTGLDPANEIGKSLSNVKKGMSDVENTVNNATVGEVTKAFTEMYKSGQSADREAKFNIGGVEVSTKNTIAGMVNSFQKGDVGKGFSVLLNDCIPCNLRFEAVKLTPDISFLEKIIQWSVDFIDEVRRLALDLVAPAPIQADICASLNLLNFTCLPDFNALTLTLGKGLTTTLSLPKFKLPGLGDLVSMIIVPILAMFANLAQTWMNLVIKPIDCLLKSLQAIINKFKLTPGKNTAAINVHTRDSRVDIKGDVSVGLSKEQTEALNKKILDPTIAALEKIRVFIKRIRSKVANAFQKLVRKYTSAVNQSTKSIYSLMTNIQEVMKIASMLKIVLLLKSLFETKLTSCASRGEALKKTYEESIKRAADMLPGKTTIETPTTSDSVRVARSVNLTNDETEALGFSKILPNSGLTVTTTDGDPSTDPLKSRGDATVNVSISRNLQIGDCSVISNREQFISVDKILGSF